MVQAWLVCEWHLNFLRNRAKHRAKCKNLTAVGNVTQTYIYIASQVSNAFMTQNPNSTKLNTYNVGVKHDHLMLKPPFFSFHTYVYEILMVQILIQDA